MIREAMVFESDVPHPVLMVTDETGRLAFAGLLPGGWEDKESLPGALDRTLVRRFRYDSEQEEMREFRDGQWVKCIIPNIDLLVEATDVRRRRRRERAKRFAELLSREEAIA